MRGNLAIVAGASSGLGSALCALLIERGYRVAALGRETALRELATRVSEVNTLTCELTSEAEVDRAFSQLEATSPPASVVIYNAHRLELRPALELSSRTFEDSWRVNCYGAFLVAQRALPGLLARRAGTLIFSGATGSIRGGKRSAAFASSKFALRGLAQSLAREFSPQGIHVAHVVLDGLIWSERTRARFDPREAACMSPEAVAHNYLALIEQGRSAWTHELELRPWLERF